MVPVAQQALADVALAHKNRLAVLRPQSVDALGVRRLELDPALVPGIIAALGFDHVKPPAHSSSAGAELQLCAPKGADSTADPEGLRQPR